MKKRYLGLLALATILTSGLAVVNEHNQNEVVDAASTEVTFSSLGYSNGKAVETVIIHDDIKVTFDKGSNSNAPKYYTTGNAIRIYGGNTFTVSSTNHTINSISFSFASGEGTNQISANTGSFDTDTWTGEANTIQFSIAGSSGHRRLSTISVVYDETSGGETPEPIDPTTEVYGLLDDYYNNGNYIRETTINLTESTMDELVAYFHEGNRVKERTTYFTSDALWMLNESGTYSYYGTKDGNMTSARTANYLHQPKNEKIAALNTSMEDFYTTMEDISTSNATWTKDDNGVFKTSDSTLIQYFLDFTAPCFYGIDETKKNYFTLSHVEVEKVTEGLELRLVCATVDSSKFDDGSNSVLSKALVKTATNVVTLTKVEDAKLAENNTPVYLEGTVVNYYSSGNNSFILKDEWNNEIIVYSPNSAVALNDKVVVDGKKTTYSGNIQVASGSKVSIVENGGFESQTYSKTFEEAYDIASNLEENIMTSDLYTVSASVKVEGSDYYLTNGTNDIQLYKGDNSSLHNGCVATVTGRLTIYEGTAEFVKYTIGEVVNARYNITFGTFENGSVTTTNATSDVEHGTEITLNVQPAEGYEVEAVYVNETPVAVSDNVATFTIQCDVNVTATFKLIEQGGSEQPEEVQVTASKSIADLITQYGWDGNTTKQEFKLDDNVTVKVNGGDNSGKAYDGNNIRLYATDSPAGTLTISVPEGYELVSVKISAQTGTYAYLYVDGTSADICNKEVTVSGSSVLLKSVKKGSSGKQVRITGIQVVYKTV